MIRVCAIGLSCSVARLDGNANRDDVRRGSADQQAERIAAAPDARASGENCQ
jgi:hypothetical protein